MDTPEIVNWIVAKFGGNRIKFTFMDDKTVWFVLGHNEYRVTWLGEKSFFVEHMNACSYARDNYSRWVEGILNDMVRNEAGEMVPR